MRFLYWPPREVNMAGQGINMFTTIRVTFNFGSIMIINYDYDERENALKLHDHYSASEPFIYISLFSKI